MRFRTQPKSNRIRNAISEDSKVEQMSSLVTVSLLKRFIAVSYEQSAISYVELKHVKVVRCFDGTTIKHEDEKRQDKLTGRDRRNSDTLPSANPHCESTIAGRNYPDDTQIYLALSPNDYSVIDSLCQCIDEINSWMCQHFLQLNKEKTEVIAFGSKEKVLKVNAYLNSRGQTTKNQVRNLGVILEADLSFSSHVKAVTKSAYYHLKNITRIRCFVSSQDLEKLVHPFITSRVDYCNGLLTGLPKKTIRQLQLVQNAAARILTRTRKSEHITPVLRSLHWLPVIFRIDFKVLLLIYKSLNGLGPKYIADMLTEYKPNRPLRSLGSSQLEIPRVHTKQGESAFSYYAARSWNQLPEEIKCAKTLTTFKSRLKTHLFSCAFTE
ncbi:hypothetical protein M9458_053677 [Cirrhinus mrigala]|uniref:Reverse transcriptase domain-containing protein n=1 Tax=Cirrhinus mrigala TaxID=683832 RepID=A0ABD0MQD5_CIRMR